MLSADIYRLYETGLLFEINRKVLNPVGFHLEIKVNEEDRRVEKIELTESSFVDIEGPLYSEKSFLKNEKKFLDFMETMGHDRLSRRKTAVGFEEQISADQGNVSIPPPKKSK